MTEWVLFYVLDVLFFFWVVRWGGADWLEGTFTSWALVNWFAPSWSAEGIKLFVWVTFIGTSIWFVVGLFDPSIKAF